MKLPNDWMEYIQHHPDCASAKARKLGLFPVPPCTCQRKRVVDAIIEHKKGAAR